MTPVPAGPVRNTSIVTGKLADNGLSEGTLRRPDCIDVVAGILETDSRVLIASRGCQDHFGEWEFPGGKIEAGESAIEALRRELNEELGVVIANPAPLGSVLHDYPSKQVSIQFFVVTSWRGRLSARQGQRLVWVALADVDPTILAAADQAFWRSLKSREATGLE